MAKTLSEQVPEALTVLYLRLNGFMTSGLVLHSDVKGNTRGDVDCLAVRFPHHDQRERGVGSDKSLKLGALTECLICEVKSSIEGISFNKPIREQDEAVDQMLRWLGFVEAKDLPTVTPSVRRLLQDGASAAVAQEGVTHRDVRIRAVFACPSCQFDENKQVDRWILYGDQMMRYIRECLVADAPRQDCATKYSCDIWGSYLEPLVDYFKTLPRKEEPSLKGLTVHVLKAWKAEENTK